VAIYGEAAVEASVHRKTESADFDIKVTSGLHQDYIRVEVETSLRFVALTLDASI
jgi:hypothetical protein